MRLLSSNPGRSGARALGKLPASTAFPLAGERTAKTRLCVTFNGMITGHLGMMPLSYNGDGIYKSIIDGTKAKIKPLPKGLK